MMSRILAAACAAGAICVAAPAFAGSCPANKIVADGAGQPKSNAAASGVTDTVVDSIDLAQEPAGIKGRLFRLRKLVIQPGGVVPWHSHADRPAIILVVSGEIAEYSSACAVPILHKAGESTPELHHTRHWWKNLGNKTVVLYSADLFPVKGAENEHQM